jgi:hypothetical protein
MSDAEALRRWLAGRRATEKREWAEVRRAPLSPEESWRQALQLIAFAADRHGWPLPDDPLSAREDDLAYARWRRLRAAWRARGA